MTTKRKIKGIWIPIEVWELEVPGMLPIHRCLLAEIDSLSKPGNPCRAGNKHLSSFFKVSIPTISRAISWLHEKRLVRLWYEKPGNQGRRLMPFYLNQNDKGANQNDKGANQNDKGANQNDRAPYQNDKAPYQNDNHRIPLEYPLEYPESVSAKTTNQVAEDGKEIKNPDRISSPQVAPRPPSGKRKQKAVLFSETRFVDFSVFEAQYKGTDYELVDLRYYHERLKAWSDQGNKRKNWISVASMFMLNDRRDGKLVLITHSNNKKNGSTIIDLEQVRRLARRP